MPFGLGKTEKRPEDGSGPAAEETPEDNQGRPTADGKDGPEGGGQPEGDASGHMAFRPAFLDSNAPSERALADQPPEGDAFFISITKEGGAETHRFDDVRDAQSFVEQLIEKGVPQDEVTAFSGRRVALKVTHRPLVHLTSDRIE